jgi:aryl sulfotransferase
MHHVQTWWVYRDLDNILFVHFADLLAGAFQEIRRIAGFLEIPATDEQIAAVAQQTSLTAMRTRAEQHDLHIDKVWVGGARSFFYKGTNGRWQGVLSDEELALYDEKAARVLTPECRVWLEQGRIVFEPGGALPS